MLVWIRGTECKEGQVERARVSVSEDIDFVSMSCRNCVFVTNNRSTVGNDVESNIDKHT